MSCVAGNTKKGASSAPSARHTRFICTTNSLPIILFPPTPPPPLFVSGMRGTVPQTANKGTAELLRTESCLVLQSKEVNM